MSESGRQYRLYFLDGVGHVTKSHEFFADDDAAAIKIAEAWREGWRMEIWERAACCDDRAPRWILVSLGLLRFNLAGFLVQLFGNFLEHRAVNVIAGAFR